MEEVVGGTQTVKRRVHGKQGLASETRCLQEEVPLHGIVRQTVRTIVTLAVSMTMTMTMTNFLCPSAGMCPESRDSRKRY